MMSLRAPVLLAVFLACAAPSAGQKLEPKVPPLRPIAPLDLARVLDLYASGHFDEAVRAVANAGDEIGRNLRRHWAVTGQQWIEADPAHKPQRMLAAAALALETEHVRAERGDWRVSDNPLCAAACVLDWAQLQLAERGAPDRAERAWHVAAAALAGGVRDWRYLQRPFDPRPVPAVPALMDRALVRFPGDPSLRLEQAIAAAGRFSVIVDGGGGRRAPTMLAAFPVIVGRRLVSVSPIANEMAGAAADMFGSLVDDPVVGAEARLRLGYLYWTVERDDEARRELTAAAAQARDPDLRYLAQFLLGWIAIARGDSAAAIPRLEAALAERPASQSAAVALGALELQRGDADKADAIARAAFEQRPADLDPWRLFLYGHHPRWPALIAELRREVK